MQPIRPIIAESETIWKARMTDCDGLSSSGYGIMETELGQDLSSIGLDGKKASKRDMVDVFMLLKHDIIDSCLVQAMGQRQACHRSTHDDHPEGR